MQVEATGNLKNVELGGRLRIGGRWFSRGDVVALDSADADVYLSRGNACNARPGSVPVNIPKQTTAPQATQQVETVPASQVGLMTRDEASATTGGRNGSARKGR